MPCLKQIDTYTATTRSLMSSITHMFYKRNVCLLNVAIIYVLMLVPTQIFAAKIRVAVASNFSTAIIAIVREFELTSDHKVILSFGSTGKHYSQIIHGAPFDIFFAADAHRPERLEQEGVAIPESRFTYAMGKLVLWSPIDNYVDSSANILEQGDFRYMAIANPKLAPYGLAAQEVLQALKLWTKLQDRMVRGENISQTLQFIKSGNAELGFVAYSQLIHDKQNIRGSVWIIPQQHYSPIRQQAVLLKDNEANRAFLSFVRSDLALKIIRESGYDTP